MAQSEYIEKVAIVGASGRIGKHFAEELLKTGKHTITAITRGDSKHSLLEGVKVAQVDYDDQETLVAALRGQQFLIITLSVQAPPDQQSKIVKAAAKAEVPYIMPNSYGFGVLTEALVRDLPAITPVQQQLAEIESLGTSHVVLVCGYWFEWSLAMGEQWFGFDLKNKKVTFFDDGNTRINISTWRQCGRAIVALLSLPLTGQSPALSDWRNKLLYIDSFKASQRDMLDSIHRVAGTTDKDWEISYEPSDQRYKDGCEELQKGIRTGFAKMIYARMFYPNGDGDFEPAHGLANKVLGLPKEDLDECTKSVLAMVESGWHPWTG